jgi:spermidine synthase
MKKRVCIAILAMGLSGLVAEILLLREFLVVFSGNEFSIGIVLANWLILEALGAFLRSRIAEKSQAGLETFVVITILFSISLFLAIFLIRILKGVLGISIGEGVGLLPMFYSSLLILSPVSTLHGALFTSSCQIYSMSSGQDASSAGRVYATETVGTAIGGIACTYLFIPYLNTFQTASWLALLNFVVCLALLAPNWRSGPSQRTLLVVLSVLILLSGYLVSAGQADKLHHHSVRAQWKDHNVVHYQNSQFGNICVIENEGQYIFFQDGIPNLMTPIPDISSVEEFVHLPLLAHPEPKKLLVLSGGAGGVINEALKHPSIETVEYAELDPLLIDLLRRFPTPLTESELNDRRVTIKHIDGRMYLGATRHTYDVILIGVTEPSTLQANRFFTTEFFSLAKTRLDKGGILVLGLPGSLTYSNEELKNLNGCIFNTLKCVFPHIRVVPGDGTNLLFSSDSPGVLSVDREQIIERLNQRNVKTEVTMPWYIEGKLHPGWQEWFSGFVEGSTQKINSDFDPIGVFYSNSHWNALFAPSLGWLFRQSERMSLGTIVLLLAIVLLLYMRYRPKDRRFGAAIPLCIITTGFAGMIFDLMVIFAFQSIHGYVFSWIGLLVASFMAGAACGAMLIAVVLARMRNCLQLFLGTELAMICLSVGCPLLFRAVHEYLGSPGAFSFRMLFLVVSFACGLLIGSQFPLATILHPRNSADSSKAAGSLYAADLLGGWFGGIMGAVVLLPVLGLVGTGITVGLLKLTSFIVITTQPNGRLMRR